MNFQNSKYTLEIASENDASEILALFECVEFTGGIAVSFTRRPDPITSLKIEGEEAFIPIIRDKENGKIAGIGCCVIRKAFLGGEVIKTGYLTALKIHKDYRQKMPYIAEVYRFIFENTRNQVDLFYTTILDENALARKMLEKKRKNMPDYQYQGHYTTYCFNKNRVLLFKGNTLRGKYRVEKGNVMGLDQFYRENLARYDLAPDSTRLHGQTHDDFYTLRDKSGNILAACAVWNQQHYKQYIIKEYSGIYKYLKGLPTNLLGYPSFPKPGVLINYGSIALFAVKNDDEDLGLLLLKQVTQQSGSYDLLMFGLFEGHYMNQVFHKIRHIKYGSRLYTVNWEQSDYVLDKKAIGLEVGLL